MWKRSNRFIFPTHQRRQMRKRSIISQGKKQKYLKHVPYSVNFQNSHQAYDSQRKLEVNTSYLKYEIDENNESIHGSDRSSLATK